MRLSRLSQKKGNINVIKVKLCSVKELSICYTERPTSIVPVRWAVFLVCVFTQNSYWILRDKKQSSRHSPSDLICHNLSRFFISNIWSISSKCLGFMTFRTEHKDSMYLIYKCNEKWRPQWYAYCSILCNSKFKTEPKWLAIGSE